MGGMWAEVGKWEGPSAQEQYESRPERGAGDL